MSNFLHIYQEFRDGISHAWKGHWTGSHIWYKFILGWEGGSEMPNFGYSLLFAQASSLGIYIWYIIYHLEMCDEKNNKLIATKCDIDASQRL